MVIATVTGPDGNVTTMEYDGAENLSRLIWPDASSSALLYESANPDQAWALTGIKDESGGRYATFAYSPFGWVQSTEHADGVDRYTASYATPPSSFVRMEFDSIAKVIWRYHEWSAPLGLDIQAPNGETISLASTALAGAPKATGRSKPGGAGCSASSSAISYDANGNVASRTDFVGSKTCVKSDLSRNLETARIEGYASGAACPLDVAAATPGATQRKISTQWHAFWRLEARRAEPKRITTSVYNGQPDPTNGNALASCAPADAKLPDGQPIAVLCKQIEQATTDATGAAGFGATSDGPARIWTYTYNAYGQVLTANGPRTDVTDTTTYAYYSDTTTNWTLSDLKSVTNALGHVWNYTRYDKAGRLLVATDPNGSAYAFTYTPRGWLKTRSFGGQITTYEYTPWGGVAKVTLPDSTYTAYTWDGAHRLTAIADSLGNTTRLTLDNAGNITASDTTDSQGRVARRTKTDFDALGRPWKHYDAAGNLTETRHDAEDRLNAVVDAKSRSTTYTRDSLGRIQDITDPLPTPGHTGFNYDALDQLTRFVAPNGASTTFTVDGLGNVRQELSADRGTVSATFDAAGNLLTRTDARGATTVHTYDALNRLRQSQRKNSAGTVTQTLGYTWDSATGCTNGKGRLCQIVDGAGTTTFNYDNRGNRISETRLDSGQTYTTQYTFNAADRLIAVVSPTGTLLDQPLDGAGRVQALTATQSGSTFVVASAITYDGAGEPLSLTQGGGLTQVLQRNTDGGLEFSSLGPASTSLSVVLGRRYIRSGQSTSFTVTLYPSQASGTIRLCRLDCQGANLLAEGSPVDGRFTGTVAGLPVGVQSLYAVLNPNPPYAVSSSPIRRLLVGVPPNLFFEDLLP